VGPPGAGLRRLQSTPCVRSLGGQAAGEAGDPANSDFLCGWSRDEVSWPGFIYSLVSAGGVDFVSTDWAESCWRVLVAVKTPLEMAIP
jgi:hypothetical protein